MAEKRVAKYKKFTVGGASKDVVLYASPKILKALSEATTNMDLYQGVKLGQVINAVYSQGKKDGRREVFDGFAKAFGKSTAVLKKTLPHMNPGRPRKG